MSLRCFFCFLFLLYDLINHQLPLSLLRCALECLGSIYRDQGRIAGSSFPDTVQVLVKLWKGQDYRAKILGVLTRLLEGLGPSSSSAHKDIYKCVKSGFGDKVLAVRSASAEVSGGGGRVRRGGGG